MHCECALKLGTVFTFGIRHRSVVCLGPGAGSLEPRCLVTNPTRAVVRWGWPRHRTHVLRILLPWPTNERFWRLPATNCVGWGTQWTNVSRDKWGGEGGARNMKAGLPPTNEVWGKVVFLLASVILFTVGGGGVGGSEGSSGRHQSGRYASYWNAYLLAYFLQGWGRDIAIDHKPFCIRYRCTHGGPRTSHFPSIHGMINPATDPI